MREKEFSLHDLSIEKYVRNLLKVEDEVMREVREESQAAGLPTIQVGDIDGRHLEVITRLSRAQKAVEIGTLGGYSGIFLLRGMGPQGHLYTFEASALHAQVASRNFKRAGVEKQVTQYVGPAAENLNKIESEGPFDLVFVDADKGNYPLYLKWAMDHLKVGGVILGDNTFAFGKIAQEEDVLSQSNAVNESLSAVQALRQFNSLLAHSPHFCTTILPTGEGLTVGVKIK